jgi:hypothetical protein
VRRYVAPVGIAVGAAGFAAALTATYRGMRDVMTSKGGFCASGGPYVIGSHCTSGEVHLLTFGMLGLFVFGAVYFSFMAWYEAPLLGPGLFAWAVLFGLLGWNFIDLGALHKPAGMGGTGGWVVSGAIFWAMALGGLVPAVLMAVVWLRRGGAPDPATMVPEPLVRAAAYPVLTAQPPPAAPVPTRLVIPPKEPPL